jgi:predicted CXXCH cytochrome family protein
MFLRRLLVSVAATAALLGPGLALAAGPDFKLQKGAEGKLCLDCHGGQIEDILKRPFVHTPVKQRECTGCHNPHASSHGKMLSEAAGRTCLACHDMVPAKAVSTHRPIAEGGCTGCHDPHASGFKFNLLKGGNDLCAGCHKALAEGAAKAKFKHRPIEKDGCVACHNPHGSDKAPHLLSREAPGLCVECHKTDKPIFAKQHQGYPVARARCTSCHDPHGSSHRGMLYDTVHPPVAKAMCSQCHENASSPTPLRTRQVGVNLCRGCHAQKVTEMLDKGRVHRPLLEGAACLSCHGPHASKAKGLLRGEMAAVCGACHSDSVRRQTLSPGKHAPVRDGNCTACHDPHGSEIPLHFKNADIVELCGTCHDWLKHSSHPMGPKLVDPRNRNLTVQCLSCHRAHGTEYKKLMPYPTTSELCTKCHEKFRR